MEFTNHSNATSPINTLRECNQSKIISLMKKKRESRFMHLRAATYIANKQHFCNCCTRYIMPGEMYEKNVWLSKDIVYETKQHINPACDYPRDEEKEMHEEYEEFMESQRLSDVA